MTVKVNSISIQAFRGITDLDLDIGGKSLILAGENGTGKSSIVEAIEFFFSGKVSHLEGIQGITNKKHIPHVNCEINDVKVTFKFLPGDITIERSFDSLANIPSELVNYFDVAEKNTFILHRAQLLGFIIAQPSERFRAIGDIIGIGDLDDIESEIKRLNDGLKKIILPITMDIEEKTSKIVEIIGTELKSEEDVIEYINAVLTKDNFPTITSLDELDKHLEVILIDIKKNANEDKLSTLNNIIKFTSQFPIVEICQKLNLANEELKEISNEEYKKKILLLSILNESKEFIKSTNPDYCPLCEQKIDNIELIKKVEHRINQYKDLSLKVANISENLSRVSCELQAYNIELTSLLSNIQKIDELSNYINKLNEHRLFLKNLISLIENTKSNLGNIDKINSIENEFNQLKEAIRLINEISTKTYDEIQLTEEEKNSVKIRDDLLSLKKIYNELSDSKNRILNPYNKHRIVNKLYNKFIETKKNTIQDIYDNIIGDIEAFYTILHPNELHKNIKLIVKESGKGSTELKIQSFGRENEDPRALTSEGHLDSLGLCIFLSFVKKFNDNFPLIVLDDVVTTIDSGHRNKICKLLNEYFSEKQLIITTHDGIWFEQLVDSQRAYRCQNKFNNIKISKWSIENGPIIESYKPKWEKIAQKLNQGETFGVGNECRIYLEWVLKNLCQNYYVSVIYRKSGRYNLSELLDPAEKKITKIMPEGEYKEKIKNIFTEIRTTGGMGNLLSHDNPDSSSISIKEVDNFFQSISSLHKFISCPICETFLEYDEKFNRIICPNKKCDKKVEIHC